MFNARYGLSPYKTDTFRLEKDKVRLYLSKQTKSEPLTTGYSVRVYKTNRKIE